MQRGYLYGNEITRLRPATLSVLFEFVDPKEK